MSLISVSALCIMIFLAAYFLTGGADFGGGILDLFASGSRKDEQRKAISEAIGPIWEANHVWLIAVVVLLFTCFPKAFGALGTALHVPLTLMLIGIVFRGTSFTFRTYDDRGSGVQAHWGLIFSISSALTPLLLGVVIGSLATNRLQWNEDGVYTSGYFEPWLDAFPWLCGIFLCVLFAYLASVYLCVETEGELRLEFRKRAKFFFLLVQLSLITIVFQAWRDNLYLVKRFSEAWEPIVALLSFILFSVLAQLALQRRRYVEARFFSAAMTIMILATYLLAQAPYLIAGQLTLTAAAAPSHVHFYVLVILGIGSIFLFPALFYLFKTFKGKRAFAVIEKVKTKEN